MKEKDNRLLPTPEIKQRLKMAFWDYNYSADDLYNVLYHNALIEHLPKKRIYQRLLETFSWYKLLKIIPKAHLHELVAEDIVKKLRFKQLQKRYRHVRELLP